MPQQTRQLAAIMFTDIVGYTALMGKDSNKALDLVRQSNSFQKPLVEKHNGKWIKEIGDGSLVQFNSALDAVNCAIEIQKSARGKLDAKLRIGIHLGDITIENEDVYGDGVNVAARLESIADPGGIYISESIEKAIRGQTEIQTKYLGEVNLKNVDYGVRSYAIQGLDFPIPSISKIKDLSVSGPKKIAIVRSTLVYLITVCALITVGWWAWMNFKLNETNEIRSLAILPIDDLSGNQDQEYLVAGLQDNLITTISKISFLRIISKTSTLQYKNTDKSMPEIAKELGVDAIIEASLIKFGNNVRLNVQLIKAFPEEEHLWTDIFERPAEDIHSLFNEVSQKIAREINVALTSKEESLLSNANRVNPEAYKAYLKGEFYWDKLTPKDLQTALEYYKLAIEIDSNFAQAYLGISRVWGGRRQMNIVPHQKAYTEAKNAISKAFGIDSLAVQASSVSTSWMEWNWEKREAEFRKRLELNPSDANAHAFYANFLVIFKRFDEAIFHMEKALELDPFNGLIQGLYTINLISMEQFDEAITFVNETEQTHPLSRNALRASYFLKGMFDKAFEEEIAWALRRNNDVELKNVLERGYAEGGYFEAIRREAELLESRAQYSYIPIMHIAQRYAIVGHKEKTLEWLEKGFIEHDANMPYLPLNRFFDFLRDEPRFKEILRKMNLQE